MYASTGDDRCAECIREHHVDPLRVPLTSISARPDLSKPAHCLRCEDLARTNPRHHVYRIPEDLRPYYHDGVYGVEREEFLELAGLHNLPSNCLCPNCGTFLIPIHHRVGGSSKPAA